MSARKEKIASKSRAGASASRRACSLAGYDKASAALDNVGRIGSHVLVGIVDRKAVVIIELGFLSVLRLLHEREHGLALWVAAQYGDTLLVWGVDIELEREESLAILVLNYEPALPAAKFLAYKGQLRLVAIYLLPNLPCVGEW